jgi:hypothetical protein
MFVKPKGCPLMGAIVSQKHPSDQPTMIRAKKKKMLGKKSPAAEISGSEAAVAAKS